MNSLWNRCKILIKSMWSFGPRPLPRWRRAHGCAICPTPGCHGLCHGRAGGVRCRRGHGQVTPWLLGFGWFYGDFMEFMVILWNLWWFYGFYGDFMVFMVFLWCFYGDFMVILWCFYGDFMVILWWFYGDLMVILWWFYGDFIVILWLFLWWFYGDFMVI